MELLKDCSLFHSDLRDLSSPNVAFDNFDNITVLWDGLSNALSFQMGWHSCLESIVCRVVQQNKPLDLKTTTKNLHP